MAFMGGRFQNWVGTLYLTKIDARHKVLQLSDTWNHSSIKCKTALEFIFVCQNCMRNLGWSCGVSIFAILKHLYNGIVPMSMCTFPWEKNLKRITKLKKHEEQEMS